MAVQSHSPLNALRTRENGFDAVQMQLWDNQAENLMRSYGMQPFMTGTVFSEPESGLTCNLSGKGKRRRDDALPLMQQNVLDQFSLQNLQRAPRKVVNLNPASTCLQLSCDESRMVESARTSTSGRALAASSSVLSPSNQDLASLILQQNIEMDALIRLQNEKLRLQLEEARKRHSSSLMSILEQQFSKHFEEKEAELQNASLRNVELQEKVKQMAAENQIWFNVAKNNEMVVTKLRMSLDQLLLQNACNNQEGQGDTSDGVAVGGGVAEDARSCCHGYGSDEMEQALRENREMKRRKSCKACGERDVSVLLLPCRHLCLCKECEPQLDTCPVCKSLKNASLQIFMS